MTAEEKAFRWLEQELQERREEAESARFCQKLAEIGTGLFAFAGCFCIAAIDSKEWVLFFFGMVITFLCALMSYVISLGFKDLADTLEGKTDIWQR